MRRRRRWPGRSRRRGASRSGRRTGRARRLVDRRGGEDARARRVAADLADREPFAARQRRGGIEPEAAPADRLPVSPGRIAAARQAVGKGEGEGLSQLTRLPGREGLVVGRARRSAPTPDPSLQGAQLAATFRHASPLRRAASGRRASARSAASRSASLPPRPRSESRTGDLGRRRAQPRSAGLDQHVGEARRQRQRGDRAAMGGRRGPSASSAPSACSRSRASSIAAAGGGSSQRQARADRPRPRARSRAAAPTGRLRGFRADRCAGSDGGRRFLPQADGDARRPAARRGRRAG